ncbi:MAG: choice-of-anchor D domain-containing protein [Lentimicrobiaceae bacterium]|nr:choice-of-anchor D domain-containing protein [Lentimicrobiaceae bacterium]
MKKSYAFILGLLVCPMLLFASYGVNGKKNIPPVKKGGEWTITQTFQIVEDASGLAWDGTSLYCGIYGSNGNNIYQINPSTGSYSLAFTGPQEDAYGLTFDGTYFWTIIQPSSSSQPAKATQFDYSGNLISQFDLPTHYMSGIAYDNGDFWVAAYYPDPSTIYKVSSSGVIQQQFTAPDNQPWDVCVEGDYLWIADYWGNHLYKVAKTDGSLQESHVSESTDPAGIVYDGQYLWYIDNGTDYQNDMLYKVDLGGSGTPVIHLPAMVHNYGNITVGDSATWNMVIENSGTGELFVTNVEVQNAVPIFYTYAFPANIAPGGSITIPIIYAPTEQSSLNTVIVVKSSDPVTPEVEVELTGEAVYDGPHISISNPIHNYGNVRVNAITRWFVEVNNTGNQPLVISDINISSAQFTLDESVNFPITVPILGEKTIGIWFNPTQTITYDAQMNIFSNDVLQNPFVVELSGTGDDSPYPIGEKLWEYTITGGLDNSPKAMISLPDITGDGIDDVIVGSEDYVIRCLNGNSSGQADVIWEFSIYSGAVYQQADLSIIPDIDEDGYSDVIVGTVWGDCSIIALSGKTGAQIWKHDTHEYGDGGWVYQVDASFDFNNDGTRDVLACAGDDGNGTGPNRVYCLNGLNGNSIWEKPTNGPAFAVIGIEDINGDGKPDVLAGASDEDEIQGTAYAINGINGALLWSFNVSGSSVWALVQLDDINGDSKKDVAVGDFSGHYYLLNSANGNVLSQGNIGVHIILRFQKFDDVNGDGHPDFAIAHSGSLAAMVDGFTGDFLWTYALPDMPWTVARIADVSGDHINDVIYGTLYTDNFVFYINGVNGEELKSVTMPSAVDALTTIPDINGDFSMEVVAGGREGEVKCLSGGLDGSVGVPENPEINISEDFSIYPNPVHSQSDISFSINENERATLNLYSVNGKKVTVLLDATLEKGIYNFNFDAKNFCNGIYIAELIRGQEKITRKMMICR